MLAEQHARILARLRNLIPSDVWDEDLMTQLIEDAEDWVKSYTNRTTIPDALLRTIGDLALISYNRLGTEGETGRSEAGESYSFDSAPAHVFQILNKFRLARVGGYAHETSASDDSDN